MEERKNIQVVYLLVQLLRYSTESKGFYIFSILSVFEKTFKFFLFFLIAFINRSIVKLPKFLVNNWTFRFATKVLPIEIFRKTKYTSQFLSKPMK